MSRASAQGITSRSSRPETRQGPGGDPFSFHATPNEARDLLFQPAYLAAVRASAAHPLRVAARQNDLTGWAPHASQQQPLKPGSARTRLADVLKTQEIRTGEKPG